MTVFEPVSKLLDQNILDNKGEIIGTVYELFLDATEGRLEYVRIKLDGNGYGAGRFMTVPWSAIRQTYDARTLWCVAASKATLQRLSRTSTVRPTDTDS